MGKQGTVAEYIIDQLAAWGVRRIYGLPGSSILGLLDAIRKNSNLAFYVCHHEETAAFMASAQAKLTGEMGVCLADGGPGTVHLVNGLYDAVTDHVPVLALTGQNPEKDIGTERVQFMHQSALLSDATGFTATVTSPEQAPRVLEAAVKRAYCSGVAVHVALAANVQAMPAATAVNPRSVVVGATPRLDEAVMDQAADLLRRAKRPMLLAGRATRGHAAAVLRLAEALGAGVVNTLPAKGALPESDGLVVGCIGLAGNRASEEVMSKADLVLVLGSTWWPASLMPKRARVIQVDLKPERLGEKAPVELGIVGDVREVVEALSTRLGALGSARGGDGGGTRPARAAGGSEWAREIAAAVKRRDEWIARAAKPDGVPVHPAYLIRAIEQTVDPDAILAIDTGDHTQWFGAHFRGSRQDVLLSGMWRSMGFGLPAGLAAKIARPDRQVLCLVGDGGLGMVLADLATAAKYGLGVTVVVSNNGAFALEAHKQAQDDYPLFGQEFVNPDFAAVARGVGAFGRRLQSAQDLPDLIREALESGGPALVDVPTRRVPPPQQQPAIRSQGALRSPAGRRRRPQWPSGRG